MSGTTRISLTPSPGFCIKSTSLNTTTLPLPSGSPLTIPANLKIFVNIAWDKNVPAPPEASEDAIERAIAGDVALAPDASDPEDWFVPVIVSEPRQDKDKAGKPSAVFDCIFNSSLKSRALRSPEFKTFLIELAFQRIEVQYGVQLSRQIGTPNIASKGKLTPRSVLVPTALLSSHASSAAAAPSSSVTSTAPTPTSPHLQLEPGAGSKPANAARKPLIEEVDGSPASPPVPKSILKKPSAAVSPATPAPAPAPLVPDFSWSKTDDGRLRIVLSVPNLTRASISHTTLDLEPRRLIFSSPASSPSQPAYALDLDLDLPDASIEGLFSSAGDAGQEKSARQALTLKRQRALDVDGARAEWRVEERLLVLYA
ncbi:hypothetical protein PYCCODRAFT_1453464 [Trametes coccinea BRFM310]|uniref:PIH1 N-terminal domain-containing protein n=1 Tax=Trametes coccinea (strain BRFM310) TaxID=1353009 RepID=A0A1Y2IHG2_TRAC3|nr:hypothetical protein PYCCODRAFT_1453464 [Trametes coccinea BRFM310]